MAVYVVLSFDNDLDAKKFTMHSNLNHNWNENVEGIFKKPVSFCDPSDGHRRKMSGWTRGRKWGWWVCGGCGKPSKYWASESRWWSVIGSNLLPVELRPTHFEHPDSESPEVWNFLVQ